MRTLDVKKMTRKQLEQFVHRCGTDSLTGCMARPLFDVLSQDRIRQARTCGRAVGVVMTDLDNLKAVNDTYTDHSMGDRYIRYFGEGLRGISPPWDYVGRQGDASDEFIVLIVAARKAVVRDIIEDSVIPAVQNIACHIDARFREEFRYSGLDLGVSVGYSISVAKNMTLHLLSQRADRNMYKNKNARKRARERT